jgi:hypothetical protein
MPEFSPINDRALVNDPDTDAAMADDEAYGGPVLAVKSVKKEAASDEEGSIGAAADAPVKEEDDTPSKVSQCKTKTKHRCLLHVQKLP